jgi:hypothetical protein
MGLDTKRGATRLLASHSGAMCAFRWRCHTAALNGTETDDQTTRRIDVGNSMVVPLSPLYAAM